MNQLQQTEFQLLKIFISICEKLNLKYFLVCGSALGAAKYQGFIPWDDDIDVALPRKDYEIFLKNASNDLPEWVFLQNYKTDPRFPVIFTKLRDSRTTYIENNKAHLPINHGVFIDIFPLDGYPKDKREIWYFERKKHSYTRKFSVALKGKRRIISLPFYYLYKLLRYEKKTHIFIRKFEQLITSYSCETSEIWCNHGNWQGKLEYAPKEQYGEGSLAVFEGMKVRIPERYNEYLTQKYGNWRADIPENEKQGHHFYSVCDLEHPYTDYTDSKGKNHNKAVHLFEL